MNEELEKLLQYREDVVAELSRRVERLKKIDRELASQQLMIESAGQTRHILSGDTSRTLVQAAYRAKLRKALEELQASRGEAAEDVGRAEQRLREVDEEIEALQSARSVAGSAGGSAAVEDESEEI